MAGAAPDVNRLLELLQRAAEELKVSQQETVVARSDAEGFAKKLVKVEAELLAERERAKRLQLQIDDFGTSPLPLPLPSGQSAQVPSEQRTDHDRLMQVRLPRLDDNTNTSAAEPGLLEQRLEALQGEFLALDQQRRAGKEQLKTAEQALETMRAQGHELQVLLAAAKVELEQSMGATSARDALQKRLSETEHDLAHARQQLISEQARGADLVTRLHAWEARAQELELALAQERALVADRDDLLAQNSQLETELNSLRASSSMLDSQLSSLADTSSDSHRALGEAQTRIAQLEQDLVNVRSRRDELNVELARVEGDRTTLRARTAELETAATRERGQHQQTAQQLLDAQTHSAKLEGLLAAAVNNVGQVEAELSRQHEALAGELARARAEHDGVVASLQARIAGLDAQLVRAKSEWHHVERQYEALHKEMLTLLDQRDEARRLLSKRG